MFKSLCLGGLLFLVLIIPGYILAQEKNEPQFLNAPSKLAFDQQNNLIYVLNTKFVSVFDARDYSFVKKIEILAPLDFYLDNLSKKIYITQLDPSRGLLMLDLPSKDDLLKLSSAELLQKAKAVAFKAGDSAIKVLADSSKSRVYVFIKNVIGNRLAVIDSASGELLANIAIPYDVSVYSIVDYLSSTGEIYLLTSRGGNLLVLNPAKNSIKNIKSPMNGWMAFSLDNERKNVYALAGNSLFVINGESDAIVSSKSFDRTLYRIFYDSVLDKILVTDWTKGVLTFVVPSSLDMAGEVVLPAGAVPEFLVYAKNQRKVYIANTSLNSFFVVDPFAYSVLTTFKSPPNPNRELMVNPTTGDVVMPSSWFFSNLLFVVKPDNKTLEVPDGGEPFLINFLDNVWGVYVNKNSGVLYLVNNMGQHSKLTAVDPLVPKVLWSIAVGQNPRDLIIDYSKNFLYLVCSGEDVIFVVNQENGEVVKKIDVKSKPVSIISDSSFSRFFSANSIDNTVSVINPSSGMVEADIKVGRLPKSLFLDEKNNLLYVWNIGEKSVSVVDLSKNAVRQTLFTKDKNFGLLGSYFLGASSGEVYLVDYYGDIYGILKETSELKLLEKASGKQYVDAVLSADGQKLYLADQKGKAVDIFYTDKNISRKTVALKEFGAPVQLLIGEKYVFVMLKEGVIATIDSTDILTGWVFLNREGTKSLLSEKYQKWQFDFVVPSVGARVVYNSKDSMIYFPTFSANLGGLAGFSSKEGKLVNLISYDSFSAGNGIEKTSLLKTIFNSSIKWWLGIFFIVVALFVAFNFFNKKKISS